MMKNTNQIISNLTHQPLHVIALAIVLAGVSVAVLIQLIGRFFGKRQPPVVRGIPIIGGALAFINEKPLKLMTRAYKQYGEVWTVPIFHKKMTFLIGPDVSQHFFKASDDEVSQREVYAFNVPTFGPGVVYDVDLKTRNEQFRFFSEALKANRLKQYVSLMVQEAEEYFGKWGATGEVDFAEEFGKLIIMTASRTLLGREVREQMFDRVADLYHDLDMGMRPISVLFPYLPIEAHRKRDKARLALADIFAKVIQNRRDAKTQEPDVLQSFIDARYKDGRELTNLEITGLLIAVLFAGQHTSSITSAWTGLELFANKTRCLPAVMEEQKRVMAKHGNELNYDVLQEMDVLHRSIKEALRMHPPLVMLMRYALEPFDVKTSKGEEYHIPKGHILATSPTFAHRLESVFDKPDLYNPDRFAPPMEEDKKKPVGFIGFGHGRHGCMGEIFAYMQIKTIWSILLRNFDFELVDALPEPDYDSMVIGPKPCRVRYTRKKL